MGKKYTGKIYNPQKNVELYLDKIRHNNKIIFLELTYQLQVALDIMSCNITPLIE